MLIGGFGLGQGSLFLAQTWLIARGDIVLLADFGICFSFATLGTMVVEAAPLQFCRGTLHKSQHRKAQRIFQRNLEGVLGSKCFPLFSSYVGDLFRSGSIYSTDI